MLEIDTYQRQNSIWTWQSNKRGAKFSLWLPYVSGTEKIVRQTWLFTYNSSEVGADQSKSGCVMFYDASGAVPVARTDELSMQHVPCSRASAQQRAARRLDYSNTAAMIFGTAPTFDQILVSVTALDTAVNRAVT